MNTLKEQPTTAMADLSKAFFLAIQEKNIPFIMENTHHGFLFTSPRGVVLNKENFINNFVLNPDLRFEIFQASDDKVVIAGNASIVNALLQVKLENKTDFWERVTLTLVLEQSKWLILAWHATFIPEKNN
jgi:uncharacterized protein DUF4440